MDHLPTFLNATRPYPCVPYLGVGDYHAARFQEYAARHGWDVGRLRRGDFLAPADKTPSSRAAFLQDWLYFGTLHALTAAAGGGRPRVRDFVEGAGAGRTVTARGLEGVIRKSVSAIEARARKSEKNRQESVGLLGETLDIASSVVRHLWRLATRDGGPESGGPQCPLPAEVVLSIMVLGSSIDKALAEVGLPPATARDWGLAEAARRSMQSSGWCRRDVALAANFLSPVSLFCASHLRRSPESRAGHGRCTEVACETRQTDEATYRTRHRADGCGCGFWRADLDELRGIIRQGRIPYVQLRRDPASGTGRGPSSVSATLKSLRNSIVGGPHNRLVIFSHVWSDGLGNPRENALPMCQLERFYDMLCDSPWEDVVGRQMLESHEAGRYKGRPMSNTSSFPPKSWRRWGRTRFNTAINIWIDTLCVPIDDEVRKMAIGMLKRYYSFAAMTVVLDKELCALRHRQYAESELLLRIALSGWMSRCWTMQEAIVAGGSLAVRFDDGWYPLMDAVAFVRQKSSTIGVNVMNDGQKSRIRNLRAGMKLVCIPLVAAVMLCNCVQVVGQGCCHLACHQFPRAVWKAVRPRKRAKPSAASETMLAECKRMFAPIARLCQHTSSARRGDGARAADAVERAALSWHGLRYRNTSHGPDRFVNFAFGCAMRDADFDLVGGLLGLPAPDRLRAWLLSQDALPSGLLFLGGPKMDAPGYRWAPSDIHPGVLEGEDAIPARCVRGGHGGDGDGDGDGGFPEGSLQLYKPGWLLGEEPGAGPLGRRWAAREPGSDAVHTVELLEAGAEGWRGGGRLGVVLCRAPAPGVRVAAALLAGVVGAGRGAWGGRFCGRAVVETASVETAGGGGEEEGEEVVVVRRLAGDQKWIVS